MKKTKLLITAVSGLILLTGCGQQAADNSSKTSAETSSLVARKQKEKQAKNAAKSSKIAAKAAISSKKAEAMAAESSKAAATAKKAQAVASLSNLTYKGTQTININDGIPTFSSQDLLTSNGAWERYGELDSLNRATSAEALLNRSIMPTGARGDISSVTPTGWKNKRIKSGYLYNRSHLIGFALAGENANLKNLITGTAQLNNPEMLRHEMDVKYYLEQDNKNYVRYSVTPIFRGQELLARGVHMMAQSVNDNNIRFNIYIFNVQSGVQINYADGSSILTAAAQTTARSSSNTAGASSKKQTTAPPATKPSNSGTKYVDANGRGLIKGSNNGIYHIPGSTYYNRTTNPAAWFKTVAEAQAAGYRAPKQ